jgi:FemAB-related protein (PEP-CTERM system-associated)
MTSREGAAVLPLTISVSAAPSQDWDEFVRSHNTSIYFLSGWAQLAHEVFGHRALFVEARNPDGRLAGVLPVVQQKSLLGNFMTSIPFFNYGGALADTPEARFSIMSHAREIAREAQCSYLELRDTDPSSDGWRARTDKVTMILQLPATTDALAKALGSKLRSQIKRAAREVVSVRTGGRELLEDFYCVFAENMRDLGTPVYPKKFFAAILERFSTNATLVVIDHDGVPSAAAFLVIDGARAEIPWASCRAQSKSLGLNMMLYWEVLSFVIGRGSTSFDFGRSTLDSGTYKFKKQWGAEPQQLYWHRWERDADPAKVGVPAGNGRLMHYATSIWQKLPLRVANALGPLVSPSLPW